MTVTAIVRCDQMSVEIHTNNTGSSFSKLAEMVAATVNIAMDLTALNINQQPGEIAEKQRKANAEEQQRLHSMYRLVTYLQSNKHHIRKLALVKIKQVPFYLEKESELTPEAMKFVREVLRALILEDLAKVYPKETTLAMLEKTERENLNPHDLAKKLAEQVEEKSSALWSVMADSKMFVYHTQFKQTLVAQRTFWEILKPLLQQQGFDKRKWETCKAVLLKSDVFKEIVTAAQNLINLQEQGNSESATQATKELQELCLLKTDLACAELQEDCANLTAKTLCLFTLQVVKGIARSWAFKRTMDYHNLRYWYDVLGKSSRNLNNLKKLKQHLIEPISPPQNKDAAQKSTIDPVKKVVNTAETSTINAVKKVVDTEETSTFDALEEVVKKLSDPITGELEGSCLCAEFILAQLKNCDVDAVVADVVDKSKWTETIAQLETQLTHAQELLIRQNLKRLVQLKENLCRLMNDQSTDQWATHQKNTHASVVALLREVGVEVPKACENQVSLVNDLAGVVLSISEEASRTLTIPTSLNETTILTSLKETISQVTCILREAVFGSAARACGIELSRTDTSSVDSPSAEQLSDTDGGSVPANSEDASLASSPEQPTKKSTGSTFHELDEHVQALLKLLMNGSPMARKFALNKWRQLSVKQIRLPPGVANVVHNMLLTIEIEQIAKKYPTFELSILTENKMLHVNKQISAILSAIKDKQGSEAAEALSSILCNLSNQLESLCSMSES